jgi:biopolymer transport protein TolQ
VDHPFIATLLRSGPVGQTILAGLLFLSIYTWAVIISKSGMLRKAEKSCRTFLDRFRESGPDWLHATRGVLVDGPLEDVYEGAVREYRAQRELAGAGVPLHPEAIRRIEVALETEIAEAVIRLERGHLLLAIAASASPFIGLFGTVWGIMNAFRGMSMEGSAGIAAVAPGVAEALVTTVAGLAVAIPAVIAYNLLNRRVQLITSVLDRFATEFVRTVHLAWARSGGTTAPPPGAEASPAVFARRSP